MDMGPRAPLVKAYRILRRKDYKGRKRLGQLAKLARLWCVRVYMYVVYAGAGISLVCLSCYVCTYVCTYKQVAEIVLQPTRLAVSGSR